MQKKYSSSASYVAVSMLDMLRNSWFLIAFVAGAIYWVARQDSSIADIKKSESRITVLESRMGNLDSGIASIQTKIDSVKEDVNLIKQAVLR